SPTSSPPTSPPAPASPTSRRSPSAPASASSWAPAVTIRRPPPRSSGRRRSCRPTRPSAAGWRWSCSRWATARTRRCWWRRWRTSTAGMGGGGRCTGCCIRRGMRGGRSRSRRRWIRSIAMSGARRRRRRSCRRIRCARPSARLRGALRTEGTMGVTPFLVGEWAEAVFHVLAHVGATARLASSVYDPAYVAAVRGVLGAAEERLLGEDARLLGEIVPTFGALARVQGLAWLFRSRERVVACAGRDLGALAEADVDAPELLAWLAG